VSTCKVKGFCFLVSSFPFFLVSLSVIAVFSSRLRFNKHISGSMIVVLLFLLHTDIFSN